LWLPLFVFAVMTAALLVLFGTTVGKRLVGIRITATGERNWPWPVAMVVRTLLLCLALPAVCYARDQRGLHDRSSGAACQRLSGSHTASGAARTRSTRFGQRQKTPDDSGPTGPGALRLRHLAPLWDRAARGLHRRR